MDMVTLCKGGTAERTVPIYEIILPALSDSVTEGFEEPMREVVCTWAICQLAYDVIRSGRTLNQREKRAWRTIILPDLWHTAQFVKKSRSKVKAGDYAGILHLWTLTGDLIRHINKRGDE